MVRLVPDPPVDLECPLVVSLLTNSLNLGKRSSVFPGIICLLGFDSVRLHWALAKGVGSSRAFSLRFSTLGSETVTVHGYQIRYRRGKVKSS